MNMAMAFAVNGKDFFNATFKILRIVHFTLPAIWNMRKLGISDLAINIA